MLLFSPLMSASSRLARIALLPLLAVCCVGAAPDPEVARPTVDDQDAVAIDGIFDFQLPKILDYAALRFTVTPHWSDFLRQDVVRLPFKVRYSFSRHFEGSFEMEPYFDNFGGHGPGGVGVAEYTFGAKYAWNALLQPYVDTALGATVVLPAPGAVPSTNLGTTTFNPYVVFSRDWQRVRDLSSFLNLECEIFDSDPAPGKIAYRPSKDNFSITPGVVLHRAPWHYTMAVSWRSTLLAGDNQNYVSLLPSVTWEVPTRLTRTIGGRWVAGLGYEAIFYDGGVEQRLTGRLKWDFDWRKTVRDVGNRMRDHLPWSAGPNGRDPRPASDAR